MPFLRSAQNVLASACLRFIALPAVVALLLPVAARAQVTYTGSTASENFGSVSIGSPSTVSLSFSIAGGTTVGSIEVVTQGAPGLDFTNAGTGSCAAQSYGSTASCTVAATFTPIYAGLRRGAVLFWSGSNNSGSIVGKAFIYGVGNGGQVIYGPATWTTLANPTNLSPNSLYAPTATAEDGSGNLYVNDSSNNRLVEYPVHGSPVGIDPNVEDALAPTEYSTLSYPNKVVVDGAGDVWIADTDEARIVELPVGGGTPLGVQGKVNGIQFNAVYGVDVDGLGNVYITDTESYRVLELTSISSTGVATGQVVNLQGNTLLFADDVWLDAAGDLFISDAGFDYNGSSYIPTNPQVLEVHANGTVSKVTAPGSGCAVEGPWSAEGDAAGNLFIGDDIPDSNGDGYFSGRMLEYPAGGGDCIITGSLLGETLGGGVGGLGMGEINLSPGGDIYLSDLGNNRVLKMQRSVAPTVSFATHTTAGTLDSTDGTQTVQITNIGNEQLDFSSIDYPADFVVGSGSLCTGSTTLAINASCNVGIEFYPQNGGTLNESVTLNDNAQGLAQQISVSGTGEGMAPTITSGDSTTFIAGTNGSFTVTASGTPTPTFSESGTLPNGVSFSGGVLSGTPSANTGGVYPFTITASNGIGSPAMQSFILTVDQSASITSSNSTTFSMNSASSFTVTATGYPAPTFSETGALPNGVTLTGQGMLVGIPTGTSGSFPITITASNGVGSSATQSFTLYLNPGPATHLSISGGGSVTSSTAFSIQVSAYDQFGNLATGDNDTVSVTSSDPLFGTPGPFNLVNGTGMQNVVLKTAGAQSITAIDIFNPSISGTSFYTVQPGSATSLHLVAPSSAYVGSPISYTLTAYDLVGNVATGYSGTVLFTSSDPNAVLPGSSTISNGTGTFSATMGTAGSQTITAIDASDSLTGVSGSISVTIPNYVVTVASDDAGDSSKCTVQPTPGANTADASCSLRDALAAASAIGSGNISFDSTAFASAQTITLSYDVLNIPSYTSIWGATSGSGATLTDLVTVNGNNQYTDFSVGSGVTGASINNLIITGAHSENSSTGIDGGGIDNQGTLTVAGSTISGNNALNGIYGSFGGGILNGGTLKVTNSTISGNTAARNGGGIFNSGTLTITNTTISGNSANSFGGGIYVGSGSTLTATNSTFSSNSAEEGGIGGIDNFNGAANLANTIVAGNTGGDTNGDYTDLGGNQVGAAVNLSGLGSYGGPTQTMLPLPGSSAICAGLQAEIASGQTTDQRGFANTNAIYPGYNPGAPCVDSGAVQTNYAIGFSTEPTMAYANLAMTPAPVVSITENNMPATAVTSTLQLTDTATDLQGTSSTSFSAGAATFSNLLFPAAAGSDQLNASLVLNGGLSIAAESTSFQVNAPTSSALTSPANGSVFTGTSATFTWNDSGASAYYLLIGTQGVGSKDLYNSAPKSSSTNSYTFTRLPLTGATIYVRLTSVINGNWVSNDYQFTAAGPATITSPANSSTLLGTSTTFNWSPVSGANGYFVWIGTTGVGSSDLYYSAEKSSNTTSYTFSKLPLNGATIYVRLITDIGGNWVSSDSQYTATAPAVITSPANSSALSGQDVTFNWSTNAAVTGYFLQIGTQGAGSSDLYYSAEKSASTTSYTFTKMPVNGEPIYVRLITDYSGTWVQNDYQYSAGTVAGITSPTPLSTLPGSSATFTWTGGTGATGYYLLVGTQGVGSNDIYNSTLKSAATTSYTVTNLPAHGQTIYVRLSTNFNGTWVNSDYQYSAATGAKLTLPALNSRFTGSSATFSWTSAANAGGYYLWIGSSLGANDIYNSTEKSGTSYTFTGLPTDGRTIYVRLYTAYSGTWTYNDYQFTAAD